MRGKLIKMNDPEYRHPGRRGNTTCGPDRRGNKDGRKPIYAKGVLTFKTNLMLSTEHFAKALYAGDGNLSNGIRKLLDAYAAPAGAPLERFQAEAVTRSAAAQRAKATSDARNHARYASAKAAALHEKVEELRRGPVDPEDARLAIESANEEAANEWDDAS